MERLRFITGLSLIFCFTLSSLVYSTEWYTNPANGNQYTVHTNSTSWQTAEEWAVSQGGHLVAINDQAENDWIVDTLLPEFSNTQLLWIGLYKDNGVYNWVNGEPVIYTNWHPTQPDSDNLTVLDTDPNRGPGLWWSISTGTRSSIIEIASGGPYETPTPLNTPIPIDTPTPIPEPYINTPENFPDPNFLNRVESFMGGDFTEAQAAVKTGALYCQGYNIRSLIGIEYFTSIHDLYCGDNQLTSLDVSNNTALEKLWCFDNQLTSLDVSNNTALESLYCHENQLTNLDVSNNTALIDLRCHVNQLTSLDISNNTALEYLVCSQNQLTSLDVSNNTALRYFWCEGNQLTEISSLVSNSGIGSGDEVDVSYNNLTCDDWDDILILKNRIGAGFVYSPQNGLYPFDCNNNINTPENFPDANFRSTVENFMGVPPGGDFTAAEAASKTGILDCSNLGIFELDGIEFFTGIQNLWCNHNHLTNLDVSYNIAMTELKCYFNQLTNLDVSHNYSLISLYCDNNQLTGLDVSNNTVLNTLYCGVNQLTSLDLSGADSLKSLWCFNNKLTNLDVSNNPELIDLKCYFNQLTNLYVSHNTALIALYCGDNQLISLDVSKNSNLNELWCVNNQLNSLDVSNNIALKTLRCDWNQLTSLDVSSNIALTELWSFENQLTSLDISNNIDLKYLHCYSNQLSTLDLSNNTDLIELKCYSNPLSSLDISKNTSLVFLHCYDSQLTHLDISNNSDLCLLWCFENQLTSIDVSNNISLKYLRCERNNLTEISSLVSNAGLGSGDEVDVSYNDLTCDDWDDILTLQSRIGSGFVYSPQNGLDPFDCTSVETPTPEPTLIPTPYPTPELFPYIEDANVNVGYNVYHNNGQIDSSYKFGLKIDAFGEFSEMQTSDVTLMANGTSLNLDYIDVSLRDIIEDSASPIAKEVAGNPEDASKNLESVDIPIVLGDQILNTLQVTEPNFYIIKAGGIFENNPILGEYVVDVRDSSDTTASHIIGTLLDYPQDAPILIYPAHTQVITERTPTFVWNIFNFTYNGNPVGVSNYCLDLEIPSGELFSLWDIPCDYTSEQYFAHLWWNHKFGLYTFLPPLPTGNHTLNLGAFQNIGTGFNFSANRTIQFTAPIAEDINNDGYVNILDLVMISIHFGRQVNDGLNPIWTFIGDGSIPDRSDVNSDGVVNILDMVRVSISFDNDQAFEMDTYINANSTDTTSGQDTVLVVHSIGPSVSGSHVRTLMQFNVNIHSPNSLSAIIKIRLAQVDHPGSVKLYGLEKEWDDEWASWNTRMEGINWEIPGGVFDTDNKITEVHSDTANENGWMSFDITPLFKKWVNGDLTNYGVILYPGSLDVRLEFDSMESSNPPYLEVTY